MRLDYKKPFSKTTRLESGFTVEKIPLPDYEGLKLESFNLRKVFILEVWMEVLERGVHTGGLTRDKNPAFVFQTNTSIFLQ